MEKWKIVLTILVLINIAVSSYALVVLNSFITLVTTPTQNPQPTQPTIIQNVGIGSNPSKGVTNGKIIIIEFSDYQCPYCERAEPTINQMISNNNDVTFYFRNYPLPPSMHPDAGNAANAAQCANEQGKFWEYHDKLYENQNSLGNTSLKQYAADLGLDITKFNSCFDSSKYSGIVNQDESDGTTLGVTGTPTFFIGNSVKGYQAVVGAQPLENFQTVINSYK